MSDLLQPFSGEFQRDPYPTYRRLREQDPVHAAQLFGARFWVLTRYREVAAALRDPRLSARASGDYLIPRAISEGNIFFLDPPDHTRLRSVLTKEFLLQSLLPRRPQLEDHIERAIDQALQRECAQGHFDIVHDLAVPVSLGTIMEFMGLPGADRARLLTWTEELAVLLDPLLVLPGLPAAQRAARELLGYFRAVLAERRRAAAGSAPPDLLSVLLAACDREKRISEAELIATAIFTLIAGYETMTNVVGSGLLALHQSPAQRQRLQQEPSLLASAFEEMLRFAPPGHLTMKTAREDLELGGRGIRSGEVVVIVFAAANRDPEYFPDPDRFDVGRTENRHLSFGLGAHYCLGMALARLQGQLLLAAILRRLPGLLIEPTRAVHKPGIILRGLRSLPANSGAPLD